MDKKIQELKRKVKAGDQDSVAPLLMNSTRTSSDLKAFQNSLRSIFTAFTKDQLDTLFCEAAYEITKREESLEEQQELDLNLPKRLAVPCAPFSISNLGKVSPAKLINQIYSFMEDLRNKKAPELLGHGSYVGYKSYNDVLRKSRENLEKANISDFLISGSGLIRTHGIRQETPEEAKRRAGKERKKIKKAIHEKKLQVQLLQREMQKIQKQIDAVEGS